MKSLIEQDLESRLVKELEDKKNENANEQINSDANKGQCEVLEALAANSLNSHFDRSEIEIKDKLKSKRNKTTLFSNKIGTYDYYHYGDWMHCQNLPIDSMISSYLIPNREIHDLIYPKNDSEIIDLCKEENFYLLIFKYLDSYRDINLAFKDLELRNNLMKVYVFHILNHLCKRKEEIEINDKIEKIVEDHQSHGILKKELFISQEEEFLKNYASSTPSLGDSPYFQIFDMKSKLQPSYSEEYLLHLKDQGLTFPKILILVPYKKHAKLIIEEFVNILRLGNWKGILNKKRFKEEYSEFDSMNDCFRMGISLKYFDNKIILYSPFDESDIIIASPLGLKLASPGQDEAGEFKNNKVYDFLSSIEILLIDFSEVFLYQNLEHLEEILTFLNQRPKNNQNIVNINRIKDNYIEQNSGNLRQNIIVSHFKSLDIELLVKQHCKNIDGIYFMYEHYENIIDKIKDDIVAKYESEPREKKEIKFEFKILKTINMDDPYTYKFDYFTKNIWQNLYETFEKHTLIFAASSLDYLRLKAFFKKNSKSVTFICEDTDKKDWQRNRLFFEEGRFKFLLYSERGHFFKKIDLRFAKNIFFYSLPEDPLIFKEMIELIDPIKYVQCLEKYNITSQQDLYQKFSSVISLVTSIEKYNLEKILGNVGSYIFNKKLDFYSC